MLNNLLLLNGVFRVRGSVSVSRAWPARARVARALAQCCAPVVKNRALVLGRFRPRARMWLCARATA